MAASLPEPYLTVAIPTYNGAAHLSEALSSILRQDNVAFALVVSDDYSDDDTLEVVRATAGSRARSMRTASDWALPATGTAARLFAARRFWQSSIKMTR